MATGNPRAARERKQKIFVLVGGVLLLALLAFQLPKLLAGSEPSAAAPAAATTADGTPSPAPATTPVSFTLTNSDPVLPAAAGQLRSLSLFDSKDPFVQQVIASPLGVAGASAASTTAGKAARSAKAARKKAARKHLKPVAIDPVTGAPVGAFTLDDAPIAAVTVIRVNGAREKVPVGNAFPTLDPVFVLVSTDPSARTVQIGIAGGSYATGQRTLTLALGKPLTLVNTANGASYRLVLVTVGSGKGGSQSSRGGTTQGGQGTGQGTGQGSSSSDGFQPTTSPDTPPGQ